MKAKVTVDDKFLKEHCYLFKGSEVTILRQRGRYYHVRTNAGQEVTMRANELKILKNKVV